MTGFARAYGGLHDLRLFYNMSEKSKHLTRLENIYARLHPEGDNPSTPQNNFQSRMNKIITLISIQSLIANIQEAIKIIPTK